MIGESPAGKTNRKKRIERLLDQYSRALRATLAATRKDKQRTQAETAELMCWTTLQVVNVERGRRALSVPELIVLSKELNVDPEMMFRRILKWYDGPTR